MTDPFKTPLQKVMFYDKYSRYNHAKHRRETWDETVGRVMDFFHTQLVHKYGHNPIPREVWAELGHAFANTDVMPSMRVLQMAGPALERCHVGGYNCAFTPLESPKDFADLLYILMQGTGVGFSVERCYVQGWPKVRQDTHGVPMLFQIDDTTESWCDALRVAIQAALDGVSVEFDYSAIRPFGAPLKTKGGKASGPAPLRRLLEFVHKTIRKRAGKRLRSIDLHDIACYCGQIVQVGGVRRAALISLSSADDELMQKAKNGHFWNNHPQRAMANNSVVYDTEQEFHKHFPTEFNNLRCSGTGERGLFLRYAVKTDQLPPRRNSQHKFGINPCGEIILRPRQFCNLSIAVCRESDTIDTLRTKVRAATLFGLIQATLTDFRYIDPQWKINCEEERLLGVDITGQFDNIQLFTPHNLAMLQQDVNRIAEIWSKVLRIPMPAATTCIKPSGNSAQLLNTSSGVHPRYAPFYVRRLRIGAGTTMAKFLIQSGVPHKPEIGQDPEKPSVWVFDFPVASPPGNPTRNDITALDQLDHWKLLKTFYTEHNPSCTIYVRDHEWSGVKKWIEQNHSIIGGLSFLPFDGGEYELAPYEELDEVGYRTRATLFPPLDFDKFLAMDKKDETTITRDYQCLGNLCEF